MVSKEREENNEKKKMNLSEEKESSKMSIPQSTLAFAFIWPSHVSAIYVQFT